jgi:tetratricopeptide (TPR) repeat protein
MIIGILLALDLTNCNPMKKNKYIVVDLLLLGLTIVLMLLFGVIFYSGNSESTIPETDSVSVTVRKDLSLLGEGEDKMKPTDIRKTDQMIKEALVWVNADKLDSAMTICDKAMLIDSTDTRVYFLKAKINTLLNRNPDAIKNYTITLKLNPKHYQAYLNRGLLCLKEKKRLNALFDFMEAVKLKPLKTLSFILLQPFTNEQSGK